LGIEEMMDVAKANGMEFDAFQKEFIVHCEKDYGVVIFLTVYKHTAYAKPPKDGKVRSLDPDYRWITVASQLLVPKPSAVDSHPIRYSVIYSA
jgi:hypothetical protein